MTKLLYLVMSGAEAEQRFDLALISAQRIFENRVAEKIKVLFYGPSETLVAKATGDRTEKIKKLLEESVIDSACRGVAERNGIESQLMTHGIPLESYSKRLVSFINEGYTVISL